MGWFEKLKIANKLSVMLVSVILVFSLLAGILLWNTLSSIMRQDLADRGQAVAASVAELSSTHIQYNNIEALDELVYLAKSNNEFVDYIFIIDPQQQIIAHTFQKGIPKNLLEMHLPLAGESLPSTIHIMSDKGPLQDVLYPVEDSSLGYIRVGVNENSLNALLEDKFIELAGIALLVGILGALFVFKLTRVFTQPLDELTQQAELISDGHFSLPPLAVSSSDEFGRLTQAMNTMSKHLYSGELERKRLLGHLLKAQENERKRIAMELHDESGQALTAMIFSIRALANQTPEGELKNYILAVRDEAANILQKLKTLAVELRPPVLDELGINAAVNKLISSYQQCHHLQITFASNLNIQPDSTTSLALYRIIQECLTNIVKHSQATKAVITLAGDTNIKLIVKDNGIGITTDQIIKARRANHLGIYGIQERIKILDGKMKICSIMPEWPTVYEIELLAVQKGDERLD